jgi:hypothetical protein
MHGRGHTTGLFPSPLWGPCGEGLGVGVVVAARASRNNSDAPPQPSPVAKSGLPDLRTILCNPGKPGLRWEGADTPDGLTARIYSRFRGAADIGSGSGRIGAAAYDPSPT